MSFCISFTQVGPFDEQRGQAAHIGLKIQQVIEEYNRAVTAHDLLKEKEQQIRIEEEQHCIEKERLRIRSLEEQQQIQKRQQIQEQYSECLRRDKRQLEERLWREQLRSSFLNMLVEVIGDIAADFRQFILRDFMYRLSPSYIHHTQPNLKYFSDWEKIEDCFFEIHALICGKTTFNGTESGLLTLMRGSLLANLNNKILEFEITVFGVKKLVKELDDKMFINLIVTVLEPIHEKCIRETTALSKVYGLQLFDSKMVIKVNCIKKLFPNKQFPINRRFTELLTDYEKVDVIISRV